MDVVTPLSLLEVTMSETINANGGILFIIPDFNASLLLLIYFIVILDCIIIDDDDDETPDSRGNVCNVTRMEVEVDPLFVSSSVFSTDKPNGMPTLWVSTNITNLAGVPHAETVYRRSQYSSNLLL